ncbi:CinA family protein [Dyadobacter subterraneus]|uniref:CinA family protein n=1 Tax=Dyadobacter subterraneus TaxID=2773304 RepID=A0ABR9WH53_9BACT|nr:CinA family protein [Dyadobacter subterraneus]MBE9464236.1 CinA family protein [Dyadobacter subterraneus]
MPSQHVINCSHVMAERNLTIAFVESATGGRMASEFSLVPNAGKTLIGGLVCYDACMKEDILGVPADVIEKYTPESEQVTKELAARLRKFMKADIHVAVTGLTTEGGSETPEKPVGTMFVHAYLKEKSIAFHDTFEGSPEEIILQTIDRTAKLVMGELATT